MSTAVFVRGLVAQAQVIGDRTGKNHIKQALFPEKSLAADPPCPGEHGFDCEKLDWFDGTGGITIGHVVV